MSTDFIEEITNLIELRQEGPYWDFKKEWYKPENDADLLIDIICMANNLVNHDGFIIIGIDESAGYKINDISSAANRKTTQNLTDFLRSKKFAGEFRPVITVESIKFPNGEIDIIVVHNSTNTPFFLRERYKDICQNNIYVRLQDSNTPRNQSADYHDIELLWKKRFGIQLDPTDKVKLFLKCPEDWAESPSQEDLKYYKNSPEYTIERGYSDDSRTGYVYYLFNQTDSTPHWTDIHVKYHQTTLVDICGVILDGGRAFTAAPDFDGFCTSSKLYHWDVTYNYMVKDSLTYLIHKFYSQGSHNDKYALSRLEECILIFLSDEEKVSFIEYAKTNWVKKESFVKKEIWIPYIENLPGYDTSVFKEQYRNVQILRIMLEHYRNGIQIAD